MHSFMENSVYSLNFEEEVNFSEKKNNSFTYNDNFDNILRADDEFKL
jgi:hypothetical protein